MRNVLHELWLETSLQLRRKAQPGPDGIRKGESLFPRI